MQHDTSDMLFPLIQMKFMTFNWKGCVDQEFSFIVKIKKKSFLPENLTKLTFSDSVQSHD